MPSQVQPEPKAQFEPHSQSDLEARLRRQHKPHIQACLIVLFSALALACVAHADTVTLPNGDRLTGKIVKSDGKELTLETDYTGSAKMRTITVEWPAVRQITTTAPIYVVTPQGTTVGGTATTEGTDLVIAPATGPAQRIPLANVTTLRSQSEETAYEGTPDPRATQWLGDQCPHRIRHWRAARADPTNLTVGFNATRATLHDKAVA